MHCKIWAVRVESICNWGSKTGLEAKTIRSAERDCFMKQIRGQKNRVICVENWEEVEEQVHLCCVRDE